MERVINKFFAAFVLMIGLGSTMLGQDLSLDSGVKPHPGLDAVYTKFSKAYRDLDHEVVGGLYTKDASYLVPDQSILIGREKITPRFKNMFDSVRKGNGRLEISFRIVQRRISNEIAYDVGIYTLTRFDADGKGSAGQGKFVVVALKEMSGEWRFQVDGYSGLPKPQQ